MDAIMQSVATRESELTAIARLVIYAQGAARDLGATEVQGQLAKTLDAIIRELDGTSGEGDPRVATSTVTSIGTRQ